MPFGLIMAPGAPGYLFMFGTEMVVFLYPFTKLFLVVSGEAEEKLHEALHGDIAFCFPVDKGQELVFEFSPGFRPYFMRKATREICREKGKIDH